MESIGTGLLTGINVARRLKGLEPVTPPPQMMLGALVAYIHEADPGGFQPMNANFGLLPPLPGPKTGKTERREAFVARALNALEEFNNTCVKPIFK